MDIFKKTKEVADTTINTLKSPIKFLNSPKNSSASKSSEKIGKSPGTIVYLGKKRKEKVEIEVIDYNKDKVSESKINNIKELLKLNNKESVSWINFTGIHDIDLIQKVGEIFNLHPLLLEDICNPHQRPKVEEFDNCLFFVLKMISYDFKKQEIQSEQLSLVLGDGYVISFQETKGDIFDPLRQRLHDTKKKIRSLRSDYLFYTLLDIIVDNYFLVLEGLGDQIELVESNLKDGINNNTLNVIYNLKKELIFLRKSIWPLREMMHTIERGESKLIKPQTQTYLRDVYDHAIRVMDSIDTYRDMVSGLQDLLLSITSNKMNEIMKVLTIISTIFIPLTFLAGIYGMNFEHMPELSYRFSYFILLGIMVLVAIIMVIFFKKKNWIFSSA